MILHLQNVISAGDAAANPMQGWSTQVSLSLLGQLPWDATSTFRAESHRAPAETCPKPSSAQPTPLESCLEHSRTAPGATSAAILALGTELHFTFQEQSWWILLPSGTALPNKGWWVTWVTPFLWSVSRERHSMHYEPEVPEKEALQAAAHTHQLPQWFLQLWTFPMLSSTIPQLPPTMGIPNRKTMQDTHQEHNVLLSSWVMSRLI